MIKHYHDPSLQTNSELEIPNYFQPHEIECRCGCGMTLDPEFLSQLNELRHAVGRPFYINSGARCPDHNRKEEGAPQSAHLLGRAADIRILDQKFANSLEHERKQLGLRRGKYRTFYHIDNMLGDRQDFDMTQT